MSERSEHREPGGSSKSQPPHAPARSATVERPAAEVVVALATLRCLAQTLAQIGDACQLSPEQLARSEARDALEYHARLPVDHVCGPAFAPLDDWFALFGDDLTLELSLAGIDPSTEAGADDHGAEGDAADLPVRLQAEPASSAAFAEFCGRAQRVTATQGDDIVVDLRLRVTKRRALAAASRLLAHRPEYFGSPEAAGHTAVVVYYHLAALNASLSLRTLVGLEARQVITTEGRLIVVVCDARGYLAGLALEVIGAGLAEAPEWLTGSRAAWRQFLARAAAERHLREQEGSWANPPAVWTPQHLRLTQRASGLAATLARLRAARAELAAAYLASAVQGDLDRGLVLRFAGIRPTSCVLGPAMTAANDAAENAAETDGEALARLAAWAYRDASSEKLAIARECLAREVPPGESITLARLQQAAIPALEAAKANFLLYVRGNIEQYFKVRQAAQDAVAAYGTTVRKAVGDLTGDVVENLYRTVGVLAGALLVGLVQPEVSLGILRLATALYTLYMGFLLAVPLRAAHDRFQLEREGLADRLGAMPELSETERARMSAPAQAADAHFRHYFWLSLGIYAALGVASLLFFLLLWTPLAPSLTLPHALAPR